MGLCGQYFRLLITFIKLKSWKLLFSAAVFAAVMSNNYLYKAVDSVMLRTGEKDLHIIGAKEFQEDCVVLGDPQKYPIELSVVANSVTRMSGLDFNKHTLESCITGSNCHDKYFRMLLGQRQGKVAHYIDYQSAKDGRAKLKCQLSTGTELYCPFMAYLVGVSKPRDPDPYFQYNASHVFRLLSTITTFPNAPGPNGTICKSDAGFPGTFPRTIMTQMIFVTITLAFYLLVSTVSCIYELRQNGFLQLMYLKGLSGLAYWFALWTITLLELAIFAAVLTMAYHFQCAGFYASARLIQVFLCCFLQFCQVAAIVLLLTVITRSIAITSLLACLYHLVAVAFIVANRMFLSKDGGIQWLKYIMLVVPMGHIAEQVYAALMKGLIPADKFTGLLLPVTGILFVLLVIATIYLDFVLKSGSGLNLPHGYLFLGRFWSRNNFRRVDLEEPRASVMVEEVSDKVKPVICACRLNKVYRTCITTAKALTNFSANFYQDQITAIVGHNGSGKSTLLQILSGDRHATKGRATMNKRLLTDPLSRYHLGDEIGYCPQPDALVDRLTVLDTLKLTASSSGLAWADVQMDVEAVLAALQVEEKIHHSIGSLSSSDKRKVCVTMALVGKPRVILLDNPSRDMDYISKRRMWSLLHEYKKGRVIIFSTLVIDEAEGMADRIIFLSGGKVICAGSSFFFKRAFDCRYIIQVASKTEFHVPYIIRRVTSKFSTVRVRSIADADVELEVSILEDNILPQVALEIENMSELVDEFGVAHYSLDDVYSKLKAYSKFQTEDLFQSSTIGYVADDVDRIKAVKSRPPEVALPDGPVVVKCEPSKLRTIWAVMLAQLLQMKRSVVSLIIRAVVPAVLLVLLLTCSILEKNMKNDQTTIKVSLSDTANFEGDRGACLYFASPDLANFHLDPIKDDECTLFLTGTNRTLPTMMSIQLLVPEYTYGDFKGAILNKKVLAQIAKQCRNAENPCPLVFSTDWCPDRRDGPINTHDVYVGTYVTSVNSAPMNIAMTSIEIYRNTFTRTAKMFTRRQIATVRNTNTSLAPDFDTEGILDIRSIFFPFYGMFIQLILLAVTPAIFLNDVMQDKTNGVRRQLESMGVTRLHYWICTALCHWIQLFAIYILSAILLIAIVSSGYANPFFLVGVIIPTLTFGLINGLLCVYVVSTLVESVSYLCIALYSCLSLVISLSALVIQSNDLFGQIMIYLFPQYAIVAPTIYGTRLIHYSLAFFKTSDDGSLPSMLPYIFLVAQMRDALIALVAHFVLLLLLLVALENRDKIADSCCKRQAASTERHTYAKSKEANVMQEVEQIEKNPKSEENIMEANQLQVTNWDGRLMVKDLTLGLKHGQVLGLLGPCGSGKSSAVRAIVGVQDKAAGRVDFHVKDRWLSSGSAAQQGFIGYCPKYDPLMQRLTIRENLQFYARATGVPLERVQQLVKHFRLESEVNTLAMHVTAGVRRSLTLAISILTSPRFVAIDQVSAGVDPEGKGAIWQSIKSMVGKQRSLLVATQCMEEAESLCDRICIMNCGTVAALTSIDELMHRYRRMYFLEIEICDAETPNAAQLRKDEITSGILGRFRGSIVLEQLTRRIQFGIPIDSIGRLSMTLDWLVGQKKKLNILYFSIHYATIDQTMKAIVVHQQRQMVECQEDAASDAAV